MLNRLVYNDNTMIIKRVEFKSNHWQLYQKSDKSALTLRLNKNLYQHGSKTRIDQE